MHTVYRRTKLYLFWKRGECMPNKLMMRIISGLLSICTLTSMGIMSSAVEVQDGGNNDVAPRINTVSDDEEDLVLNVATSKDEISYTVYNMNSEKENLKSRKTKTGLNKESVFT